MKLLVEGVRIWSFGGKQLYPRWFFEIVAHQKCVMFCLYDSVDLPPEGTEVLNQFLLKVGSMVSRVVLYHMLVKGKQTHATSWTTDGSQHIEPVKSQERHLGNAAWNFGAKPQ